MTMWLPRLRTSKKPFFAKIAQTSFPERRRNLSNSDLQLRDINLSVEALLNVFGRGALKKQL
jgi:hypothetical protein